MQELLCLLRSLGDFVGLRRMRILLLFCFAAFASLYRFLNAQQAHNPPTPAAHKNEQKRATPRSASVQTQRNLGKAYYEQGKYSEAIAAFQKVVASGQSAAMDHLDLGQALMQGNRLDEALGELTTAKQMDAKQLAIDYNLGILYKRELRYPDAEAALKRVAEADPSDPATWFNLGTVYFAEKKLDEALGAHQHVVEMGYARGKNFYVASTFHMFTILTRLKRREEAQKFLKINQDLRDKVPGISLQYPALEAGKYGVLSIGQAPFTLPARKAESEKVRFAEIQLAFRSARRTISPTLETFLWPDTSQRIKSSDYSLDFARKNLVPLFGTSVVIGDYDGDGHADLYVVNPWRVNHLYHNNGDGTFTDVTEEAGVAGPGASLSATFADYDNSGHPSLFVAGLGGITLYHNDGKGRFTDVTEKAGLKGRPGELDTCALLFDSDNDGLLDLVVTAYTDLGAPPPKDTFRFPEDFEGATSRLYRNNGDGTFADITDSAGLGSAKGRMRKAVFADFNNDGYADLLFVRDDAAPLLFVNKGEDKFVDRTAEAGAALTNAPAVDIQVADFNHDGNFDVALWSLTGYHVLLNRGDATFVAAGPMPAVAPPSGLFASRGTVADVNADSFEDLLAADANGKWHLIANHAGKFSEQSLELPAGKTQIVPAWLVHPGKLDLVGVQASGNVVVWERQGPPAHWVEVKFDGFKSNKQGIGNIVEFKAGNFYKKALATGDPVRVYTGELAKLDVVRTTWPNQVVQNSIDVATDRPVDVRESERLASSCPFLYVWDGTEYVFFTDVLGVAPLGELLPDGARMKPNPEELVRLGSNLHPQHGNYVFQVTNEMREADYFDQLRLLAVDHTADGEVYANEIYSSSPQPPSLYLVREKRFPVAAVDDHGTDVLPLIQRLDGQYPAGFRPSRILGLAEPHTLTLDLGDFPPDRSVALWLTGWVFWTDSNASRALLSNKQLQMIPPSLEVRDEHGQWVTAMADMGLPSGTNRTMRVDLTGKFPTRDHHVRIVTNLCVYWDQIFFTTQETALTPVADKECSRQLKPQTPCGPASDRDPGFGIRVSGGFAEPRIPNPEPRGLGVAELPLVSADLHYRGFSTPASDPQHRRPDSFDYRHVLADAPWNPFIGNYTRYGGVARLLARTDDRLVVIAAGDELTVSFSGRGLPALEPGWKRDFFLYVWGYAKDGEPNTAYSRTVAPLPFRTMSNYPYEPESYPDDPGQQVYLREYQTRPGYALIPPLAPAVR